MFGENLSTSAVGVCGALYLGYLLCTSGSVAALTEMKVSCEDAMIESAKSHYPWVSAEERSRADKYAETSCAGLKAVAAAAKNL